jgi:transposase
MPVYPVAARSARCASPGCCCRDRVRSYPSDLADEEWAVLEPRAREVMAELVRAEGRPMVHDLRAVCDAIAYLVRNGIEWRALPVDFPPWGAVYAFWERWNKRGLPLTLVHRLRERLRERQGRKPQPTACIVDSQIVKSADTVGKASRGYHGGKKITGRGRHLAVDTEGWLLALVVTAASVSDRAGLKLLVIRLFNAVSALKIMWADSGYGGPADRPLGQDRRRHHPGGRPQRQPAFLPGRPPPLGRRAHLRLVNAVAAARARLRAPPRPPRGHGLLGHRLHHDQAAGPLRQQPAAHPALGRRPQATQSPSPGSGMKPFINRLLPQVVALHPPKPCPAIPLTSLS